MSLELQKTRLLERAAEWARLASEGRDVERILEYWTDDATVTMNGDDGAPTTTAGRVVTIWRRDPDDEWRCALDIWNAEATA